MKYRITPAALNRAVNLSMSLGEDGVLYMAEFSAPITHKLGTRRYGKYIMQIKGALIIDIHLIDAGKDGTPVSVVCSTCEGDDHFCMDCDSKGYRYI